MATKIHLDTDFGGDIDDHERADELFRLTLQDVEPAGCDPE